MGYYFRPVTQKNIETIEALHIRRDQEGMVETVEQCMQEASDFALWHPVGIYQEDTPIGFAMYGKWKSEDPQFSRVWLDRFFIDHQFQGKGLARTVFPLMVQHVFQEYSCPSIYLSVFENNPVAIHLYENWGFSFTGELDEGGERIMVLHHADFLSLWEKRQQSC